MFKTPNIKDDERRVVAYNGKSFDVTASAATLKSEIASIHGMRVARQAVSHMADEGLYSDVEQCIRVAAQNIKETDEYLEKK